MTASKRLTAKQPVKPMSAEQAAAIDAYYATHTYTPTWAERQDACDARNDGGNYGPLVDAMRKRALIMHAWTRPTYAMAPARRAAFKQAASMFYWRMVGANRSIRAMRRECDSAWRAMHRATRMSASTQRRAEQAYRDISTRLARAECVRWTYEQAYLRARLLANGQTPAQYTSGRNVWTHQAHA